VIASSPSNKRVRAGARPAQTQAARIVRRNGRLPRLCFFCSTITDKLVLALLDRRLNGAGSICSISPRREVRFAPRPRRTSGNCGVQGRIPPGYGADQLSGSQQETRCSSAAEGKRNRASGKTGSKRMLDTIQQNARRASRNNAERGLQGRPTSSPTRRNLRARDEDIFEGNSDLSRPREPDPRQETTTSQPIWAPAPSLSRATAMAS